MAKRTRRRNKRYSQKRNSNKRRVSKRRQRVSRRVYKKTYKRKNMRGGFTFASVALKTLSEQQTRNINSIPALEGYTIETEIIHDTGGMGEGRQRTAEGARDLLMCNHVKLNGGKRIGFTNTYYSTDNDEKPQPGHIVYSYLDGHHPIGYLGSPDTELSPEAIKRNRVFYELILNTFGFGRKGETNLDHLLRFCDTILADDTIILSDCRYWGSYSGIPGIKQENLSAEDAEGDISMESPRIKIYNPEKYEYPTIDLLSRFISDMEKNEYDELRGKMPRIGGFVFGIRKLCNEYIKRFRSEIEELRMNEEFGMVHERTRA